MHASSSSTAATTKALVHVLCSPASRLKGAFKFNGYRQWSRRPQPRESGGDTSPRQDTRREHWRCPPTGVSGCRVSSKVSCLAAVPSRVCRTLQASFPSRGVPELRVGGFVTPASVGWCMCSTGRSAAGIVLMRDEKRLREDVLWFHCW